MMDWGGRFAEGAGLWWLFGLLCMAVLAAALIWLVVALVRGPRQPQMPQQPWQPPYGTHSAPGPVRPTPYEILRERLARGEITVEDYQRTLAALGPETGAPGQPPTAPGSPPTSF